MFPVRLPHRQPKYVEPKLIEKLLAVSQGSPRDYLIIRLMTDAGLRRQEVVDLKVRHVGEDALRIKGKGGRERTIPLTTGLKAALQPFCSGKAPSESVVGVKDKAIYMVIKKYGRLAEAHDLKPHDLRHSFAERLISKTDIICSVLNICA